jgi:ADP-L-glycero-D-manno-heptose 6-epimerase
MQFLKKNYLKNKMVILTGGAGLIGSNILKALNKQGENDIVVVDNLNSEIKKKNLLHSIYNKYYDKKDFLKELDALQGVSLIIHQGACSSTTETNEVYLKENNVEYSKTLLHFAIKKNIPFIYASSASVYGDGKLGFDDNSNDYFPINGYANSKLTFDKYVTTIIENEKPTNKIIGLRYFNVYGFGEAHKLHMSSVLYKFYQSYLNGNKEIELFEGSDKILRDFITVDDVVKVNLFCIKNLKNGIYNVGTGNAASFQNLANAFVHYFSDASIKYIDFPEILKNKYQYFTLAKMDKLRAQGFLYNFETLEIGVANYLNKLIHNGN